MRRGSAARAGRIWARGFGTSPRMSASAGRPLSRGRAPPALLTLKLNVRLTTGTPICGAATHLLTVEGPSATRARTRAPARPHELAGVHAAIADRGTHGQA